MQEVVKAIAIFVADESRDLEAIHFRDQIQWHVVDEIIDALDPQERKKRTPSKS